MADSVGHAAPFFNDIRNCFFLIINLSFNSGAGTIFSNPALSTKRERREREIERERTKHKKIYIYKKKRKKITRHAAKQNTKQDEPRDCFSDRWREAIRNNLEKVRHIIEITHRTRAVAIEHVQSCYIVKSIIFTV